MADDKNVKDQFKSATALQSAMPRPYTPRDLDWTETALFLSHEPTKENVAFLINAKDKSNYKPYDSDAEYHGNVNDFLKDKRVLVRSSALLERPERKRLF